MGEGWHGRKAEMAALYLLVVKQQKKKSLGVRCRLRLLFINSGFSNRLFWFNRLLYCVLIFIEHF